MFCFGTLALEVLATSRAQLWLQVARISSAFVEMLWFDAIAVMRPGSLSCAFSHSTMYKAELQAQPGMLVCLMLQVSGLQGDGIPVILEHHEG